LRWTETVTAIVFVLFARVPEIVRMSPHGTKPTFNG
jgi:hypothetical protein